MRSVWSLLLILLVVQPASSPAQQRPGGPPACEASEDFVGPDSRLDHFAEALAAREPVNILAVGSGTTVGEVNATPGASFPYRMVDALTAALPGKSFRLTVRGGRNLTAEGMLPLLMEALHAQHYPLVLWQTGTVEAVRGLRPDLMRAVLQAGIDAVHDADGDVVLIDPQFSRFLRANADLDPYESVLQQVSLMPGVALFHRFDLMRSWATDGHIDLERVKKPDRDAAVALLNTCLGRTLARFVLNGANGGPK
jgi:acyl-CoA thioesterase-1